VLYGDVVFIDIANIDLDQALSAITKELEKNRDNWEAWAAKADILCSMGLYENAIQCCNRSLAINPDNSFTEATKANALNLTSRIE
jgi:tetratricopeptide (TPR) repeat protein